MHGDARHLTVYLKFVLEQLETVEEAFTLPAEPILFRVRESVRFDGRGQAVLVVRPERQGETSSVVPPV